MKINGGKKAKSNKKSRTLRIRDWVDEHELVGELIDFAIHDAPLEVFAALLSCTSLVFAILAVLLGW